MSLQESRKLLSDLPWPVLMLHGALTNEFPDSGEAAARSFALLKDGSQLVQVANEVTEEAQAEVSRLGTEWFDRRLR